MRYVLKYIFGLIGVFALFSSCAKDPTDHYGGSVDEGQKVLVQLSVKIPSVNAPKETLLKGIDRRKFSVEFSPNEAPRTKSDGTTKLYNLWAFQFDASGNINGTPQKISDEVTMVNDMAILDVTLNVATDQTLYLVVLGKKVTGNMANVRSKAGLESLALDYVELNNGLYSSRITSEEDVPFAGSISGVSVKALGDGSRGVIEYNKPEGFGGGIEIKRMVSRILLKQKFDLSDNTLQGVRLLKVPTKLYINAAAVSADAMSYVDIDSPLLPTDKDSEGFYTTVWYVAPNLKGTNGNITTENDRYRKVEGTTVYGNAPEFGTNIEVWSYSNASRNNYTVHQIYVGKNNTNNFDVEANTYYNLSTVVNSSDVSDGRIRAYSAKQQVYLTANSRGYSAGLAGATDIYFDVHPGQRPVIIYTQGRNVTVGIYSDPACTVPVDMSNPLQNWLQLSEYANYTEVVRNKPNSIKNALSTDIILPTRLRFYLYCDEYLYNEDGTLPTTKINTYKDLKERTLYVKVVTTELGVEKPQKLEGKYTIKQRQGIYCGLFGGKLENGQYEKVLFMDNVDEFEFRYDDVYPTSIPFGSWSATPKFGYKDVFPYGITGATADDYKKLYNGKGLTIALSENESNALVAGSASTYFPEMRKINGVIDLYQYDYYKTFAARFCYDLNRDENGNGVLETDEVKWYLASPYQGLAMMAGFGSKKFPASGTSSTTYNNMMTSALETTATYNYSVQETGYGSGSGTGNTGKLDQGKVVHCVREVDTPPGLKTTNQVGTTTVNGDTYALLDLSDMPDAVTDRTQNLDKFYMDVELYTYSTSGELTDPKGGDDFSQPSLDGGNQLMVRRIQKHGVSKTVSAVTDDIKNISFVLSRKFIISPTDVYSDGDTKPNAKSDLLNGQKNSETMTWAVANGWLATANTVNWDIPSKATMTGCYAYQGKSGTDPRGTWRVPTYRELSMIMVFIHEIENTSGVTGFQKLGRAAYNSGGLSYWGASQGADSKQYGSVGGLSLYGIPFGSASNSATKTGKYRLRCVRDIP